MPTDNELDQVISSWLEDRAPNRLPDRVLLATFERTREGRQYGGWRALLRRLNVNHFFGGLAGVTAAIALALVAALAAGGITFNQLSSGGASPLPALTETYTSPVHGMSVSYPSGWHLRPATDSWNGDDFVLSESPFADIIYKQEEDTPFIAMASTDLSGRSFEDWSRAYLAQVVTNDDNPACATGDPIVVDGATGVAAAPCFTALFSDGQRGYLVWLFRSEDRPWMSLDAETSLFRSILSSVKVMPDQALSETYTSAINGMSVSYPSGWQLRPATEAWNGDDFVQQDSPFADTIYASDTDSPFIAIASAPLGGRSFDDWSNAYLMKLVSDDAGCATSRDKVIVDGYAGIVSDPCLVALVSDGQRGYLVWLYRSDDRAWFDQILSTVKFTGESPLPTLGAAPSE